MRLNVLFRNGVEKSYELAVPEDELSNLKQFLKEAGDWTLHIPLAGDAVLYLQLKTVCAALLELQS